MQQSLSNPTRPAAAWFLGAYPAPPPPGPGSLPYLPLYLRLAELYTLVFPDRPLSGHRFRLDTPGALRFALQVFLNQVDTLFPTEYDLWQMEDLLEERWDHPLYTIPFFPVGLNTCQLGPEDYGEPLQLLMYLHQLEERDQANQRRHFEAEYPQVYLPPRFYLSHLIEPLQEMTLPPEWQALPELVAYVTQRTGHWMLDACPGCYDELFNVLEWEAGTVHHLTEAWRQARPLYQRVWTLIAQVQQGGPAQLTALINLLLRAYAFAYFSDEYNLAA